MSTIAEQLKAAWAVIDSPEKWTQGDYARDANGHGVWPTSESAVCFCSLGALQKTGGFNYHFSADYLEEIASELYGFSYVDDFNDNHTYEQVASLWAVAIAQAEKDGV